MIMFRITILIVFAMVSQCTLNAMEKEIEIVDYFQGIHDNDYFNIMRRIDQLCEKNGKAIAIEAALQWLKKEKRSVFDLHDNFTLLHDAAFWNLSRVIDIFFDIACREGNNDIIWTWVCHKEFLGGRTALHCGVGLLNIKNDVLQALIRNVHKKFGKDRVLEFINIAHESGKKIMEFNNVPAVIKKILNELGIESSIS